jgi:hypothetical protein
MKAMKGFEFFIKFKIKNEEYEVPVHNDSHIGKSIKSWTAILSSIYKVKKSEVILIEKWQEQIKE